MLPCKCAGYAQQRRLPQPQQVSRIIALRVCLWWLFFLQLKQPHSSSSNRN